MVVMHQGCTGACEGASGCNCWAGVCSVARPRSGKLSEFDLDAAIRANELFEAPPSTAVPEREHLTVDALLAAGLAILLVLILSGVL